MNLLEDLVTVSLYFIHDWNLEEMVAGGRKNEGTKKRREDAFFFVIN